MKKFLILFLTVKLLLVGYFVYDNRLGFRNILSDKFGWFRTEEEIQDQKNEELAQKYMEEQKNFMVFAGQNTLYVGETPDTTNNACLIKGKLLDPQYAPIFSKIKDTLALQFGTQFYFVPQTASPFRPDARFTFATKSEVDSLLIKDTDDEYELKKIYARLVYEGKAEGYRIVPQKFYSSKYIYPYQQFQDKYMPYFSGSAHFLYSDLDYEVKEVLLKEFFNTDEGKKFGYPDDQRNYRELLCERSYTGSGKSELAVVLADLEAAKQGINKEVLLIVAYDPQKESYYLLHKQWFYDKINIGGYYYHPKTDWYMQYIDEDEPHPEEMIPCVYLKVPNESERVLIYDKEFDQMKTVPMEEIEKQYDR